VAIVQAVMEST